MILRRNDRFEISGQMWIAETDAYDHGGSAGLSLRARRANGWGDLGFMDSSEAVNVAGVRRLDPPVTKQSVIEVLAGTDPEDHGPDDPVLPAPDSTLIGGT